MKKEGCGCHFRFWTGYNSLNVTKSNSIYIIKVGGLNLSLWVAITKNGKKKSWQRYLSLQINYRKEK